MRETVGRLRPAWNKGQRALGRTLSRGYVARRFRRMHPVRRVLSIVLLAAVLAMPAVTLASVYQDYFTLRNLGTGAIHHLLAAKEALLPSSSSSSSSCTLSSAATPAASASAAPSATATSTSTPTPAAHPTATPGGTGGSGPTSTSVPDAAHLATAEHELRLAQQQFRQLIAIMNHPTPLLSAAGAVPSLGGKVADIRQLLYVGDDISTMGLTLLAAATPLLNRLHTGVLSADNTQPLITPSEAAQLRTALASSTGLLDDIEQRVSHVDASDLPLNACQRFQLNFLTSKLPEVRGLLALAPQYFDAAMWLIGVDHQRQILVQTMDKAELRPSGGFTGDFGILQVTGGRLQPFTLRDVDSVYLNTPFNYRPPAVYSWWPFMRWGLRDSNLSPDFPTTATMNIQLFEGIQHIWKTIGLKDPHLDGVVQLTTTPIAHVLLVTGPITVPKYNEVITADNMEAKIHYYQQDPAAIARESQLSPDVPTTPRKRFTYIVSHLLEDMVRHLSFTQLFSLAEILVKDIKAHEIQIYVTNPAVENFFIEQGLAGRLNTTPGIDTLMIDQANVSVSKAAPYIATTLQDTVTLDSKGGATHQLHLKLVNQIGAHQVYGYTTYRDYIRVYVPPGAQLRDANGFDTGEPVCFTGGTPPARFAGLSACPIGPGFFPDQSLVCPAGKWAPGPMLGKLGADGRTPMPVDNTGYPTSTKSDIAGLTMWGGYVTIPNGCTSNVTLTYYVPNVALPASAVPASAPGYSLLIERQAGTAIALNITIHPAKGVGGMSSAAATLKGTLDSDKTVAIPRTDSRAGR